MPATNYLNPTAPVINRNGSSAEALLDQINAVRAALQAAKEAMMAACPHARDYQTVDPEVYQQARAEHFDRIAEITKLQAAYNAIAESIFDQTINH